MVLVKMPAAEEAPVEMAPEVINRRRRGLAPRPRPEPRSSFATKSTRWVSQRRDGEDWLGQVKERRLEGKKQKNGKGKGKENHGKEGGRQLLLKTKEITGSGGEGK